MITISLCMIVKNEEKTLANCLESVKDLVNEIIIIDTGSTDKTKQIAYKYTDKVYDFEWIDDFAAARNYSFSKATMEYIMWLDADDVILEKDREDFKKLKEVINLEYDAVIMKYIIKRDNEENETYSIYRERLVRRDKNFKWQDAIHEYIAFSGKIAYTDVAITHTKKEYNSDRNYKILKKMMASSKDVHPRQLFYYARESHAAGFVDESIEYYSKFLDTKCEELCPYVEGAVRLAQIYYEKGEGKKALQILMKSFEYEPMRAEVLCLIGRYYIEQKEYLNAILWYKLAMSIPKPEIILQFFMTEYWDFIPCIELSYCYYYLGDIKKALEYHEKSKQMKPGNPAVIENQKFYEGILNEKN